MSHKLARLFGVSSFTAVGGMLLSSFVPIAEAKDTAGKFGAPQRVWMTGSKFSIPNGCLVDLDRPTPIAWFTETSQQWSKIVSGPFFGGALAPEGLFCWGYDAASDKYIAPFRVDAHKSLKSSNIQDIACSASLVFVLTKDGRIHTFDPISQSHTVLPVPSTASSSSWFKSRRTVTFKSIAVGDNHLLAIDKYGNVWSAGSNENGQCGVDTVNKAKQTRFMFEAQEEETAIKSPTNVDFSTFHKVYDAETFGKAELVTAGGSHSVIRSVSGALFSFGDDSKIQLGLGDTRSQESPDYVPHSGMANMDGSNGAVKFSETSPAVKYTFYESHIRSKPTGMKIPEKFADSFSEVFLGDNFTILKSSVSGMMICCGENRFGQCGRGFNKQQQTFSPVKLPREIKPIHVSCGSSHCVASLEDGSVYSWGNNSRGQLGTGSRAPMCPPAPIHRSKVRGFLTEDIITKIGRGVSKEEMEEFLSERRTDKISSERMLEQGKKLPDPLSLKPERDLSTSNLKSQLLVAIDESRENHMMNESDQTKWKPVFVHAGFDNSIIVMEQEI